MTKREDKMKKLLMKLNDLKHFLKNSALSEENILAFCAPQANDKDFKKFLRKFEEIVDELRKSIIKARRSI